MGVNDWLIRRMLGNVLGKWLRGIMDVKGRKKTTVKFNDLILERDDENMIHVKMEIEVVAEEKNVMDLIDKVTKGENE